MPLLAIEPALAQAIFTLVIFGVVMTIVPGMVMAERWISAWLQRRSGPTLVGIPVPWPTKDGIVVKNFSPFGLAVMQPLADAAKFIFKEDFVPSTADKLLYRLSPIMVFLPAALGLAAIPFAHDMLGYGPFIIFNSELGILFVLAATSLGVHGLSIAGWASNNKFGQMGGVRASAQLISYEAPMFIALLSVLMLYGTTNFFTMVDNQAEHGWMVFRNPVAFFIFYICTFAETNRHPFDMPEAEPELVGGYHTEYGGMRFALFFLGEYIAMINQCAIAVLVFLGGWHLPFIETPSWGIAGIPMDGVVAFGVFMGKVVTLMLIMVWVRWSLPRFRYDQLMWLGWKRLTPLALINLAVFLVLGVLFPESVQDFLGNLFSWF